MLPSNTLVLPSNTLVLPSNTLVLPSNTPPPLRMANVLAQLLPIEGHLDQTIVKHCLVQLLKQDAKAAVAGIVNQVIHSSIHSNT